MNYEDGAEPQSLIIQAEARGLRRLRLRSRNDATDFTDLNGYISVQLIYL